MDIITTILSSVFSAAIGAVVTYFLARRKNIAEIEKLKAEAEKARAETEKIQLKIKVAASAMYEEKEVYEAVEIPNAEQGADPKTIAAAYYLRGIKYQEKKKDDQAIADFSRAIQLNPNEATYFIARGQSYASKGRWDDCIENESKAIALEPSNADFFQRRAHSYRFTNRFTQAIDDYTQAIKLSPKNDVNYYWRGVVYWNMAKIEEAKEKRLKVWEGPKLLDNRYYNSISDLYWGYRDRAREDIGTAINISPRAEYHNYRASEHIGGDPVKDFTRAIELDPNNVEYYMNRGREYMSKKEIDKAISDFSRVIRFDKDYWLAYDWRGYAYYKAKDYERAIADLTIAIQHANNPWDYYWRGSVYKDRSNQSKLRILNKDRKEARMDFQRAAALGLQDATEELKKL